MTTTSSTLRSTLYAGGLAASLFLAGCSRDQNLYEGRIPAGQVEVVKDVQFMGRDNIDARLRTSRGKNYTFHFQVKAGKSTDDYITFDPGTATERTIYRDGKTIFPDGSKFHKSGPSPKDGGDLDKRVMIAGREEFSEGQTLYQRVIRQVADELVDKVRY